MSETPAGKMMSNLLSESEWKGENTWYKDLVQCSLTHESLGQIWLYIGSSERLQACIVVIRSVKREKERDKSALSIDQISTLCVLKELIQLDKENCIFVAVSLYFCHSPLTEGFVLLK